MTILDIKKLATDPGKYAPNTLYFIGSTDSPGELQIAVSSSDGSVIKRAITEAKVRSLINAITPTGTVIKSLSPNTPDGYLKCNGSSVSKTTYSALYEIIGDQFVTFGPIKESGGIPWQSQHEFNSSTQDDITDWASANSLASAAVSAAFLVTKNYIYVLGGYSGNGPLNTIQYASFDSDGNLTSSWGSAGTLPTALENMGYVATKGRIYLLGGYDQNNGVSSVYSASIDSDGTLGDFRTETPLPDTIADVTCFVIKNRLYVVGGDSNNVYRTTVNNDGTLSSWETLPNFPVDLFSGNPLLIKDRIYIFGVGNCFVSNNYYATYDSNGNIGTWTNISSMPDNIYGSTMVCTDNYVFSIGGFDTSNGNYTNASYCTPISADGSIGAWTQISNGPVVAADAQSVIAGNRIYFIGGGNNGAGLDSVYSATFNSGITDYTPYYTDQSNTSSAPSSPVKESAGVPWESQYGFNPSTQSDITDWTSAAPLINNNTYAASLVTKNYIYILGGSDENNALNTIQRASFNNDGNLTSDWTNVDTLPTPLYGMRCIATKGRVYLIAGYNGSSVVATVYSAPINPDGTLGTFTANTPLPIALFYPSVFVIKDKLYVAGGSTTGSSANISNTVYQATIDASGIISSWTQINDFPINFFAGRPLLIKDRIYIFAATTTNIAQSSIYYATYDSNGGIGTWTYVSNMPAQSFNPVVVCNNNYVYAISCSNGYSESVASYIAPILPDGSIGNWSQISNGPVGTYNAQTAIVGNKIYFIGGGDTNSAVNTVYSAAFTSGITDYTPYYTDQYSVVSNNFYLPNYQPDFKSIENYYIKY
jgi:hypothetical protein